MIENLYRDDSIELTERNRVSHIAGRVLKRLLPFIYYVGPPSTRQSVIAQLRKRGEEAIDEWRAFDDVQWISTVLAIVRDELSLPNCRFIPNDPLQVILQSGVDSDVDHLFLAFYEQLGIRYSNEEIESSIQQQMTLGEFIMNDLGVRLRRGQSRDS